MRESQGIHAFLVREMIINLAQLVQTEEHSIVVKWQKVLQEVLNVALSPNTIKRAVKRQGLQFGV